MRAWIVGLLLGVGVSGIEGAQLPREPWVDLFDGESLAGWVSRGGEATFEVVDGVLVGTAVPHSPNTFLCTEGMYADFVLELEFWVDPVLNSGVQIRSASRADYKEGRVHGYQVEIDPSARAWSGGVFEEGARGWLYNLVENPAAQAAFRAGGWNHFRIEAIGDSIRTWINGVPAAHLIDDRSAAGFIGLQVHGVGGNRERIGSQVRWRNIRIIAEDAGAYARPISLVGRPKHNTLSPEERASGWRMLWDGKTTKGWRGAKRADFPPVGWEMESRRGYDGVLRVLSRGGGESRNGGDIVTEEAFENFELSLEFKLSEGANSGIKYYVDTELNKGVGSAIGLEYQLLDDARHPDAKKGNHAGSRTLASLYDLMEADPAKMVKPVGEWNRAYIRSVGNEVEHWFNGRKVLSYVRKSAEFRARVARSKYAKWDRFGEQDAGLILLQDHGDLVEFRNIKVKRH